MTQFSQYPSPGDRTPAAPTGMSGTAVTSLVTGLLSIIPCVGVALAITAFICGILGMRATSASAEPRRSGRGLAIGGIAAACVGLLLNATCIGWFAWSATAGSQPTRDLARTFINHLADGESDEAEALLAGQPDPEGLATLEPLMTTRGGVVAVSFTSFRVFQGVGGRNVTVTGTIRYADGVIAAFELVSVEVGDTLMVESFTTNGYPDLAD